MECDVDADRRSDPLSSAAYIGTTGYPLGLPALQPAQTTPTAFRPMCEKNEQYQFFMSDLSQ
jgi:hypothetical protein